MVSLLSAYTAPLFGGVLIGVAALILMIGVGRIAGISGIASGALNAQDVSGKTWRWLFLIGLMLGALLYSQTLELSVPFRDAPPLWLLALAGLLVGFGTHWGSGCTSGHGVCGIGRFSVRSIVATIVFMLCAGVTVFLIQHVFGGLL